jgi:transcription elongation factor GreA
MSEANMITVEGLEALKAELDDLEGRGRREIAERIKTAREWGDLKENSEYHDAKNDQAHLETKIARLRERISSAEIVGAPSEHGVVAFGSTVTVKDRSGSQRVWKIVSSRDAAPAEGRISAESPVARALIGLRAGDVARVSLPRGESELTVLGIEAL